MASSSALAQDKTMGGLLGPAPAAPTAPAAKPVPPPPAPPAAQPTPVKPETQVTATPMVQSTTDQDLELYMKSGERDKKWDEFIPLAFQSFDADNFATAGIFLKKAYEQGCRDPLVLFRYAICRENAGDVKLAADLLIEVEKGLSTRYPNHPLNSAIAKHTGRALYKADRFQDALPYLEKALKLEPGDFMLLLMAGQVERMQKDYASARDYFEKALAAGVPTGMTPDPELTLLKELVILTFQMKDYDACMTYIEKVKEKDPKDTTTKNYERKITNMKQQQKELEIIKKLTQ